MSSITCEASVRFHTHDETRATVTVANENNVTHLTIIHESVEVTAHECVGATSTEPISLNDGETLTLIVRLNGQVIACAIYEVTMDYADYAGFILSPRGGFNLVVSQDRVDLSELHLVEGCGATTGPLPEVEVAV